MPNRDLTRARRKLAELRRRQGCADVASVCGEDEREGEQDMKTGAELIAEERQRQLNKEGWTAEHDEQWINGELLDAAEAYLRYVRTGNEICFGSVPAELIWPWDSKWWKPSRDRVRNLVKAGALIAAEIDRINAEQNRKAGGK